MTRVLQSVAMIGVLALPFAATARAQGTHDAAPFVDVSLLGSDVVFHPEQISYRVTADPGSYVTLILISPRGGRSVLNPNDRPFAGAKRTALYREAWTGNQSGESYIVAIATRNKFHSANLARLSRSAPRFVSRIFGAAASLDELLTSVLPAAGDDFSAAYVSFRVLSSGFPRSLAYATSCPGSPLRSSVALFDGRYTGYSLYDDLDEEIEYRSQFAYLPGLLSYASGVCDERMRRPFVVASGRPPVPVPPSDTMTTAIDSVPNPARGNGPLVHNPPAPRPLDMGTTPESGTRAMPADFRHPDLPVTQPVPVERERAEPVPAVPLSPRTDPVVPVERERPAVPVERERPVPVERNEPVAYPRSTPPTPAPTPMPTVERHPDSPTPATPPPGKSQ